MLHPPLTEESSLLTLSPRTGINSPSCNSLPKSGPIQTNYDDKLLLYAYVSLWEARVEQNEADFSRLFVGFAINV